MKDGESIISGEMPGRDRAVWAVLGRHFFPLKHPSRATIGRIEWAAAAGACIVLLQSPCSDGSW